MNCTKIGELIRTLRLEKKLTQKQLADKLNLSDKTISKWERGCGCPDLSLWAELSSILEVSMEDMLHGELSANALTGGNMKNTKFYVCPVCGSLSSCVGNASISCCGRKLEALTPQKADEQHKLNTELIENDWYITATHPMTKENYISFLAFATGDKLQILKQYPEWEVQARIPKRERGTLLWYSTEQGLFCQPL